MTTFYNKHLVGTYYALGNASHHGRGMVEKDVVRVLGDAQV